MYRSYLLKNNFWAKKGNEKYPEAEKVFIKHDSEVGGIYAIIHNDKKGVKIMVDGRDYFFNNFDKLDSFLTRLQQIHQRGVDLKAYLFAYFKTSNLDQVQFFGSRVLLNNYGCPLYFQLGYAGV